MIERIHLLLEGLSVLICLHHLYGKKIKLDILTVTLISIDIIIMTTINYYNLSKIYSVIIYPLIIFYCGIKFGFRWREIIINNILFLVIIGVTQLIVILAYGWIFNMLSFDNLAFEEKEILVVNSGVLIIVLVLYPRLKLHKLSVYLQDKERTLVLFLFFTIVVIIASMTNYRMADGLNILYNLVLFVSIVLFCLLAGQLGKYKIKTKEVETELKMQKLYSESFYNLIGDIRSRQHEFDNHINAIYSLHYTCDSYDMLVKAQNEYSQAVIKENRYNKLLKAGNPLLIGFLYGKLIEIERLEIDSGFCISIEDLDIGVPDYKIVEILGNLINNAVEALDIVDFQKEIYILVVEANGIFEIEVRNRSEFIDYAKIEMFFKKGFSKKGINRGIGLYNIKNICTEYSLNIYCQNKNIENQNWLSFTITNKKGTI